MTIRNFYAFFIIYFYVLALIFLVNFSAKNENLYVNDTIDSDYGDVDFDGKITSDDALFVLKASAMLVSLNDNEEKAVDCNEYGAVNAATARNILISAQDLENSDTTELFSENITENTALRENDTSEHEKNTSKLIDVPLHCQYPDFPSGCEIISVIMNFEYYGFDLTADEFVDNYLTIGTVPYKKGGVWYGSDPNEAFLGNPRSYYGWGISAGGLEKAVQAYFDDSSVNYSAECTYSETLTSLCEKYIDNDIPVIVWATLNMTESHSKKTIRVIGTDKVSSWVSPNHCMLLVGYDSDNYYFNDPTTGCLEKYGKTVSDEAFAANGSQALIITRE